MPKKQNRENKSLLNRHNASKIVKMVSYYLIFNSDMVKIKILQQMYEKSR